MKNMGAKFVVWGGGVNIIIFRQSSILRIILLSVQKEEQENYFCQRSKKKVATENYSFNLSATKVPFS